MGVVILCRLFRCIVAKHDQRRRLQQARYLCHIYPSQIRTCIDFLHFGASRYKAQPFSEETLIQEQQKAEDMLQAASAGIAPTTTTAASNDEAAAAATSKHRRALPLSLVHCLGCSKCHMLVLLVHCGLH